MSAESIPYECDVTITKRMIIHARSAEEARKFIRMNAEGNVERIFILPQGDGNHG